jgi:hypothetical protein
MIETSPLVYARAAGLLYLIIIVLGLFAEIFVRSSIITPGDATATAGSILGAEGLFRAGFLADSIMLLSDVALAVLLFTRACRVVFSADADGGDRRQST